MLLGACGPGRASGAVRAAISQKKLQKASRIANRFQRECASRALKIFKNS
jgi:hypothetical protein